MRETRSQQLTNEVTDTSCDTRCHLRKRRHCGDYLGIYFISGLSTAFIGIYPVHNADVILLILAERHPRAPGTLVASGSVRRGNPVQQRMSAPRLPGRQGRTGLVSAILPVLLGVMLACAWNMAASHISAMGTFGLSQDVQVTTEQAAAQAWASATTGVASRISASTRTSASRSCSRVALPHTHTTRQRCLSRADL